MRGLGSWVLGLRRCGPLLPLLFLCPGRAWAQLGVSGSAVVSAVEHRVNAGRGVELSSGTLFGGAGLVRIGPRIELSGSAAGGVLDADSAFADSRDLAMVEARVAMLPVPWLALYGGIAARAFTTSFATQRFTAGRLGVEGRLAFVGGAVRGIVRAELLPGASVSGLEPPNRAVAAAAGFQWNSGVLTAGVEYALERYDFPEVAGVKRKEQLAMLTAQLGLRLGAR